MNKNLAVALALVAATLVAPLSRAADAGADVTDMQALQSAVKADKRAYVASVLRLTDAEAQKFWPIYKDFETELSKLGDQVLAAVRSYVENYGKLTDATADQLANKVLSIEQQRNALKKKYFDRMKGSLGGITAMRFLQIENQLERLTDLQIAAQLQVASE